MNKICTVFLFLSFAFGFGQNNTAPKEDAKLIKESTTDAKVNSSQDVILNAEPKAGSKAFRKKIEKSFRLPDVLEKTSGTVIVKFLVWEDGSLRDFEIIKETPANLGLGKELIRLLMKSKKWKPALKNGVKVKQYYTMPISVQITPSEKVVLPVKENEPASKKE